MTTGSKNNRLFLLDFERQMRARLLCLDLRSKCFLLAAPCLIALLLMMAFMSDDADIHVDRFLFFATLYSFWLGLFGSCQSLNGSLASGEWRYWILGFKISVGRHILASSLAGLLIAGIQVGCFMGVSAAYDTFNASKTKTSFTQRMSNGYIPIMMVKHEPIDYLIRQINPQTGKPTLGHGQVLGISYTIFGLAMFSAAWSGVTFGLLLSALFVDCSASMRMAVFVTVFLSVVSTVGMNRGDNQKHFPLLRIWYASTVKWPALFEKVANPDAAGTNSVVSFQFKPNPFLEDASMLFPQRYFYNIARAISLDTIIYRPGPQSDPNYSANQAFPKGSYWGNHLAKWCKTGKGQTFLDESPSVVWQFIFVQLIGPEFLAVMTFSAVCLLATVVRIKLNTKYYEIR